jgi:UDP-glucose 4-epimerase
MGKIVVTGGSGFVGTYLGLSLPEEEVAIADVRPPIKTLIDKWRYADITDSLSTYDACQDASQIYHLAANPEPGLAERNPQLDVELNVIGTLNVLNAAIRVKSKMLLASTGLVERDGNYAISKRASEMYLQRYVQKYNLSGMIVRLENAYGPGQRTGFVIPDFIQRLRENPEELEIRGTGYDLREFVYVEDVVNAMKTVMAHGTPGEIYSVGSGETVTIMELAETLAEVMRISPKVVPQRKIQPPHLARKPVDISKISSLGWTPKYMLKDGLEKTLSGLGPKKEK